jgi:hypothetical protein
MASSPPNAYRADETMEKPPKKLLDQVRDAIRLKHSSIRTEDAYVNWIRRYILFHHKRHPMEMGSREIEAFLTHLEGAHGSFHQLEFKAVETLNLIRMGIEILFLLPFLCVFVSLWPSFSRFRVFSLSRFHSFLSLVVHSS